MAETTSARGRIVMLVDNNVRYDSRVQKQAKSMADRGWDVTLVGKKSEKSDQSSFKLGKANIRLLTVPGPLAERRHLLRRAFFRSPFAYAPGKVAGYKLQQNNARKADLRFRRAELAVGSHRLAALRTFWLGVMLFIAKVKGRWVSFRHNRTASLHLHRRRMDGRTDKLTTWFWQKTLGDKGWRKFDPGMWDWELAYGPVVDKLKPDLIHSNDHRMLAIGARAATRAKAKGRDVKLVWDSHEFTPGTSSTIRNPRWQLSFISIERDFAKYADSVVTVSERLADLLVDEFEMDERPAVVLNTPDIGAEPVKATVPDIRTQAGVADDIPLMVYSGNAAPQRGIKVIIESMPALVGVHLALVTKADDFKHIKPLIERAKKLGVLDRIHIVDYVPVDQIVPFLSTATFGVHPLIHLPNHEISLATKFYEYSHARLPILGSDVRTMAETIRATGQGEAFIDGDVDDFVKGAKAILADRERYVKAYEAPGLLEEWTWEKQADVLDEVYTRTLDR